MRLRDRVIDEARQQVESLEVPSLAIILFRGTSGRIGSEGAELAAVDSANEKARAFASAGFRVIGYRPQANARRASIELLEKIADDPGIAGLVVQRPHPEYVKEVEGLAQKDLDGNLLEPGDGSRASLPATVEACVRLYGALGANGSAAVVGSRGYIGSRLVEALRAEGAHVDGFDVGEPIHIDAGVSAVFSAVGAPRSIIAFPSGRGRFHLGVDVGNTVSGGIVLGDFAPAMADLCSRITPVPGGVGPLEMAVLVERAMLRCRGAGHRSVEVERLASLWADI